MIEMPPINHRVAQPVELRAESFGARSVREAMFRDAAKSSIRELLHRKQSDPLVVHFSSENDLAFVLSGRDIWMFGLAPDGSAEVLGIIKNEVGVRDVDCIKMFRGEYLKYSLSDPHRGRFTVLLSFDYLREESDKGEEIRPAWYQGPTLPRQSK